MKLPEIKKGFAPTRVIVEADGSATTPRRAAHIFQVISNIIFIRDDGWTLGAPKEFESIAYGIWKDSWTHFVRKGHTQWIPIERYLG